MRIRMLKDDRGCPTGGIVVEFACGREYDVPDQLAKDFLSTQSAEIVSRAPTQEKDIGPAPENKDLGDAPENKQEEAPRSRRFRKGY